MPRLLVILDSGREILYAKAQDAIIVRMAGTDEVCADFEAQNKQPRSLRSLLAISVNYVFVSQQEIATTLKTRDGWDIFYAKYPNSQGHMRLSGVGFNPQKDMALVYVDNMSHALAGEGYYVLLKKANGKWTVQNQAAVWMA